MSDMLFYQLFEKETSTYTYILADKETLEAVIIDSTIDTVQRDLKLISELSLKLKYILETHVHADHITGAYLLKEQTQAEIALSSRSNAKGADIYLNDGDELMFGSQKLAAMATPGHTDSCISYYTPGLVFTGDALLIRGTGRTDFQQGNAHTLFASIRKKLFSLPDETSVYPGHDYNGHTHSSILEEKQFNPRAKLENSEETFVKILDHLNLEKPKRIHEAVPANMVCGNISQVDKQG